MALTTLITRDTFNVITGKIVTEDLTDYAGQGVDFEAGDTASGYLKWEYDTGAGYVTIYDNLGGVTPDINPATSVISTADINIPLDSAGNPVAAAYRLTYNVQGNIVATGAYTLTQTFSYEYIIEFPEACLEVTVNCGGSSITNVDKTVYDVAGATVSTVTRANTLYPPPTSGQSSLSANVVTLTYTPISRKTWTAEISSTVTWLQDDGLYVTALIEGSKEAIVTCDNNLNNILCCLVQLWNTYRSQLTTNVTLANNTKTQRIDPTLQTLVLFLAAQQAGNQTKMDSLYQEMLSFSGCTEDCGCSGEISSIVQATDSGSSAATVYVIDSPDGSISVVQEVVGSVTTYHLQLSAALQQAIANAAGQVSVTTLTPQSIEVANPSTGAFIVNYIGESVTALNIYTKQMAVRKNGGAGNYYLLEVTDVLLQGSLWAALADQTTTFGAQAGNNSSTDTAVFYLQDFIVAGQSGAPQLSIEANVIRTASTVPSVTSNKTIECEVFWFDVASVTGDARLRLYNPATGVPYTLGDLDSLINTGERLYISVILTGLPYSGPPA